MRYGLAVLRHLAVAIGVAFALAAISQGLDRRVPVEAYVLVLGGLALADLVVFLYRLGPPLDDAAGGGSLVLLRIRHPHQTPPAPGLLEWEALVAAGATSGRAATTRLRPRLQGLVAERLAVSAGIDLDREPDRARAVLGEEAWALVGPTRPFPGADDPGVPLEQIGALLDRLDEPR